MHGEKKVAFHFMRRLKSPELSHMRQHVTRPWIACTRFVTVATRTTAGFGRHRDPALPINVRSTGFGDRIADNSGELPFN